MTHTSNPQTHTQITLFDVEPELPVLPYGGTSGWSGSDTSQDRATKADRDGLTGLNQKKTLSLLKLAQDKGLTWNELADTFGWHHGTASGALSVLHKAGHIARLKERRNRCAVYVALDYINNREIEHHKPNVSSRLLVEILTEIDNDLTSNNISVAIARVRATLKAIQ